MRLAWSGALLRGATLACVLAPIGGLSWSASPDAESDTPSAAALVLLEYSSLPPSAVFESGGEMFLLRPGDPHPPHQLSLLSVDESGVSLQLRLSSGQMLMVRMQRDQKLWPEQLRREFEQSLSSPYQSAEPGKGLGHERP